MLASEVKVTADKDHIARAACMYADIARLLDFMHVQVSGCNNIGAGDVDPYSVKTPTCRVEVKVWTLEYMKDWSSPVFEKEEPASHHFKQRNPCTNSGQCS